MPEFGKGLLLRQLADLNEQGSADVARDGDDFQVRMSEDARAQPADSMEVNRLEAPEEATPSSSHGGTTVPMHDAFGFPEC